MSENYIQIKRNLISTGSYLLANQLAWGTSGNMSARLSELSMLVTASGTNMGNLNEDDFSVCEIFSDEWQGKKKPTKEMPMHRGIYKSRPDAKVVLHSSPFYTTLFACSEEPIISSLFIESMYYLEQIEYVDYYHPGSIELGKAVEEKAKSSNVIIMKNHGVILFDTSFENAMMRLETLEMTCRMLITAKSAGIELRKVPPAVVNEFLTRGVYKPRNPIIKYEE